MPYRMNLSLGHAMEDVNGAVAYELCHMIPHPVSYLSRPASELYIDNMKEHEASC